VQGLMVFLILAIAAIPLALLSCGTSVFTSIAANSTSNAVTTFIALINIGIWLLSTLYGIILAIFVPAFVMRYAFTRNFGAAFNIGAAWHLIRANLGNYILIIIVAYIAQIVASFGVIACIIGVFLTYFWATLVSAHLYGQYWRHYGTGTSMMPPVAPMPPAAPTF
jgi:hypothetical protein